MKKYAERNFVISIDFDKKLEDIVKEGPYDFCSVDYQKFYSLLENKKGKINIALNLFSFPEEGIFSEEVVEKLLRENFRPATFIELITFGHILSNTQDKFFVVALGSIISNMGGSINQEQGPFNYGTVAYISKNCNGKLNLFGDANWTNDWNILPTYFLAVKIKKSMQIS